MLLADAIKRTLAVSEQIAIYTMVVDAINDTAKGFYEKFGFTRLSDDSPRLFLILIPSYSLSPNSTEISSQMVIFSVDMAMFH